MTDRPEQRSAFDAGLLRSATVASFAKLDPRHQWHNPVMFVVEIGALITTVGWLIQLFGGSPLGGGDEPAWFTFTVAVWLWLTVVFANLAEALAEGRGRAQADALRAMRSDTVARLGAPRTPAEGGGWVVGGERRSSELRRGDVVIVEAGEVIPGDGTVVEGIASVDESAITGESAPVIREAGGDRSAVTGGTRVLSDRIVVEITQEPGQSFLDRMIGLVEGAAAAQDAERDRAEHPARRAHDHLPRGRRHAAAVRRVRRHPGVGRDAHRAAGRADPDDDRRAALGDRDRRHGPAGAPQRARPVGSCGGGLGRRRRAAARQDRHDHARQPPGRGLRAHARSQRDRAGRGRADVLACRRDARGPLDRRAGQAVRDPGARARARTRRPSCRSPPRPA